METPGTAPSRARSVRLPSGSTSVRRPGGLRSPARLGRVVAATCAEADAWATSLMVLGPGAGAASARRIGLDALFLIRDGAALRQVPVGPLFTGGTAPTGASRAGA